MTASRLNGVRYAIRDVLKEAKRVEATGKKLIKLNIGDPNAFDFDAPEELRKAIREATELKENGYSDSQGLLLLREKVVEYNKTKGVHCTAEDVFVTTGLSEAIHMLSAALVEPASNVLLPAPTYPQYQAVTVLHDGEPRFYDCLEGEGWFPDVDDLRKKADEKTAFISLINPNNPTGALYPRKKLKEIIDFAGELGVPVLSDEVYDRLVFEGEHVSTASIASDVPIVTMNGLSKNFFAPGWRCGWITLTGFPDDSLKEGILKLCSLRLCAPVLEQRAAIAGLETIDSWIGGYVEKLRKRRDLLVKRCNEINGLTCVKPKASFYAFPSIEWSGSDEEFCLELLRETGVLTVHGSGFGGKGKHFRMVFLPSESVLEEAFDLIDGFLKAKRSL
jgi:aspartate/methionine/tyrosine aminotransferase